MRAGNFNLDFSQPLIMGILNLTPDSFSDGGKFFTKNKVDEDKVLEEAKKMIDEGADILDIGGESTRPGAILLSAEEEKKRVIGIIKKLKNLVSVPISIDTYKSSVATEALENGASIVNDISGGERDAKIRDVCAAQNAAFVVMHSLTTSEKMAWSYEDKTRYNDIIQDVSDFLKKCIQKAEAKGVKSIIVDPGFGFGKSVQKNFQILNHLDKFKNLGKPILAGLSLKSFIGKAIEKDGIMPTPQKRLNATIAANTIAILNGVSILRTHHVKAAKDILKVIYHTRRNDTR